ncbi:MAG TPA: alpha/beta hydrolase [bacterium]|nr:alpha/beta hydrolase [bacterium]
MAKKIQIFIIHGGMTFKSDKDYLRWLKSRPISIKKIKWFDQQYFDSKLGRNFEIIRPRMPLQDFAKYRDWKIYFERFIPYLRNNVILVGSSLGGIFLAKYLSENRFPKKILSTYLICPPFDDTLGSEDLVGGFKLKSNLALLEKSSKNLYLMFSQDDDTVPAVHAEKYRKKLGKAKFIIYKSKNGHFNISEFPEIIKMIKEDVERKK